MNKTHSISYPPNVHDTTFWKDEKRKLVEVKGLAPTCSLNKVRNEQAYKIDANVTFCETGIRQRE